MNIELIVYTFFSYNNFFWTSSSEKVFVNPCFETFRSSNFTDNLVFVREVLYFSIFSAEDVEYVINSINLVNNLVISSEILSVF